MKSVQEFYEKYPNAILLFESSDGEKFTVYNDEAEKISKILNLKIIEEMYCEFNKENFETFLKIIIKSGHKVGLIKIK